MPRPGPSTPNPSPVKKPSLGVIKRFVANTRTKAERVSEDRAAVLNRGLTFLENEIAKIESQDDDLQDFSMEEEEGEEEEKNEKKTKKPNEEPKVVESKKATLNDPVVQDYDSEGDSFDDINDEEDDDDDDEDSENFSLSLEETEDLSDDSKNHRYNKRMLKEDRKINKDLEKKKKKS